MNPERFFSNSLFIHSLVCPISLSHLLMDFSKLVSTCHSILSLKKTFKSNYERLLHCRLIVVITWIPGKGFA